MSQLRMAISLMFCVCGIYGAYLTQGVMQETLSTKRFGPELKRFTHLPALNGVQSWACFIWAFFLIHMFGKKDGAKMPPITAYWRPAVSNSIGPACGMQALKYISYPAQVLAKSSKMIPVMLVGTVLHGKAYSAVEYTCCILISAGISLFALRSSAKDEIHRRHEGGSALHMMCWMNFWCGLFYIPFLFGLTNAGQDLVAFCLEFPEAGRDILLFCLCGAVGQLFIFQTIRQFGSLVNTLVTTTRKFFNILLSVVWSGNPLLGQQWVAVSMVFGGLLASSIYKSRRHSAAAHGKKA